MNASASILAIPTIERYRITVLAPYDEPLEGFYWIRRALHRVAFRPSRIEEDVDQTPIIIEDESAADP
jgi:hypothetical protein